MSSDKLRGSPTSQPLARRIGFPLLTCYGLGTILGAGIYVLIGKVAGNAGMLAPLAFLLAAFVAAVTALSYCQLVVLFPQAAGEARYVEAGFNRLSLTKLVGYLVLFTGIVSAATLVNGFLGYLTTFLEIPSTIGVLIIVGLVGALAFSGIAESLWVAGLITALEVLGLLVVIALSSDSLLRIPESLPLLLIPDTGHAWSGVIAGAFVAFYAFIGFEDMVNIVEEVKQPEINMPKGIITALIISTLLYFVIALAAVLSMPLHELADSDAPIRDMLQADYPNIAVGVALVSLFAIINGVLAQLIMGSRILYGMSAQNRAPKLFRRVSTATKTPSTATLFVCVLTAIFAIWLPLEQLAKLTSFVILCVFSLVNLSLWHIRKTEKAETINKLCRVKSFPIIGTLLCLSLLLFQLLSYF